MLQNDLNIKEENGTTLTEIQEVLADAYEAENDLRSQLTKIKINIDGGKNPEIVKAISFIFGPEYVSSNGNSSITYEMYCSVINLIRELGKNKAQEIL